tara:strand:+ start:93 stop:530 length:438 start_codon:yes stop_codon:yes gene_type:complete
MDEIEINWKPLKLRAIDDKDLAIFSDCIYQSILVSSEVKYDIKKKSFAIALERFTWEIAKGKDFNLKQVQSAIIINGVEKVEAKNIFFNNLIYNVLSISNVDNNILILLNDKKSINLEVHNWTCFLEDIGIPKWPPVTPSHLRND